MENVLGWLVLVSLLAVPVVVIYTGIKLYRRHKQKQYEADLQWIQEANKLASQQRAQAREEMARAKDRASRLNLKTPTPKSVVQSKSYASTSGSKYTGSTSTAAVPTNNDNLLSDLATLAVLAGAMSHGSSSATVDYNSGTINVDTDSDSKRSNSYDSSPGYSDSGPSYSSSSDSGPSSDW